MPGFPFDFVVKKEWFVHCGTVFPRGTVFINAANTQRKVENGTTSTRGDGRDSEGVLGGDGAGCQVVAG